MTSRRKRINTGKPFEAKVTEAVRRLYPFATVRSNVKLPASITKGWRQIDTLLKQGDNLVDFDAKDHKRHIGIDTIAAYDFKLRDEQVQNGVIVSNSQYANSAVNAADHLGIKLTHLIDSADPNNHFHIASKTLIEELTVQSLSFGIHNWESLPIDPDLLKINLVLKDGTRLPAYTFFRDAWNNGRIPREKGDHRYTLSSQGIILSNNEVGIVAEFYFDYKVEKIYRTGLWKLESAHGLHDVVKDEFQTTSNLQSVNLRMKEINSWPIISAEQAGLDKFSMSMSVVNTLPDQPPSLSNP